MTKQKVALVRKLGEPGEIAEVDIPVPDVDQVLVKVLYTGVCQSDLHTAEGVAAGADGKPILDIKLPHIGGHEGVGDVIKIGSRVKNVKVGDRVGVRFSAWVCRDCEFCLRGCEQYCPRALNHLHHIPGSFSQYCVLESTYITRVPKDIDPSVIGPVLCAGVTVWSAIKKMAIRPGSWTVISGAGGGLGHMAVQYAKAMGTKVIAIDAGEQKADFARKLGADVMIDITKEKDVVGKVHEVTNGGADNVIVAAAVAAAFTHAVDYLRVNGTLCCVGIPSDTAFIHVPVSTVVIKGITITGNLVGSMADVVEAIEFVQRGVVKPQVTVVEGLEKLPECFESLKSGKVLGRLVIKVT